MESWTSLNIRELSQLKTESNDQWKGRPVFTLSPYDVPKAIRVYFSDEDDSILNIEYQYGAITEDREIFETSRGTKFELGKKTKRIYSIAIDAKAQPKSVKIRDEENHMEKGFFKKAFEALLGAYPSLEKNKYKYHANELAIDQFNRHSPIELCNHELVAG